MAIAIKLREAMQAYKRRTGERMTYAILAARSGIAHGTLRIIGNRDDYNATLELIEKLCRTLDVTPGDLPELIDDPPKPKKRKSWTSKNRPVSVRIAISDSREIFIRVCAAELNCRIGVLG